MGKVWKEKMSHDLTSPSSGGLQHTMSESDVTKLTPTFSTPCFIYQRTKRQRESSEEQLSSFKEEIKIILDEWKVAQNSLLNKLITEVAEIKEQNSKIKKTNDEIEKNLLFINKQYEDLAKKVECLDSERKQHLIQIATLESKIEDMERSSKSSTIELRNVPIPTETETKADLCSIVQNTCKLLNVNVQQASIRDVFRLNGKSRKGTIVAEFTSVLLKNDVMHGIKSYRKQHPELHLNSADIGLKGQVTPIYVSEALTNKGRRLFFLARDLEKTKEYKFCWTSYGKVYLRKSVDAPHIQVKDETQLTVLRNQI